MGLWRGGGECKGAGQTRGWLGGCHRGKWEAQKRGADHGRSTFLERKGGMEERRWGDLGEEVEIQKGRGEEGLTELGLRDSVTWI